MQAHTVNSEIEKALNRRYPFYPIFDIADREDHYLLYIDARAVQAHQVDIELEGEELVIRGKGPYENKRSLESLVVHSNGNSIAAEYKDGLLLVSLRKNGPEKISLQCA